MDFLKDKKGYISPLTMFIAFFLVILLYVMLRLYIPITSDYLFVVTDNIAYGSLVRLIIEILPLLIAIAIGIYVVQSSGPRRAQGPEY